MYEQFTDNARLAIKLAEDESRRLYHEYIGTEHLLAGLLAAQSCAAKAIDGTTINLRSVREEIERRVPPLPAKIQRGKLPLTPRVKAAITYAIEESSTMGHDRIGTGHLLLGLFREGQNIPSEMLRDAGLTLASLRTAVGRLMK